MTESVLTRRTVIGLIGAGAAGGTLYGLSRTDVLDFLRADAGTDDDFQVMRRPFLGNPDETVSALGFGCGSKLAIVNRDHKCIDEELTVALMDYAVRHGVNYFDTAWTYHAGESEKFLGRALKRYPRTSFLLADKMPTWVVKNRAEAIQTFEEQFRRCQVDYFDNYMLHRIRGEEEYDFLYHKEGVLDFLKAQKDKGRIRHLSLSFHGTSDFLQRLLDEYPWESVLILVNALEHRWNPDSLKVARILAERNIPILVMEPLAGGRAASLNRAALDILKREGSGASPAELGFRYALSFPGVMTVLSGMSRMDWVKENVRTFSTRRYRPFDDRERAVYARAADAYVKYATVPCTTCRYCVPCPYGVAIPEIFTWWNGFAGAGRLPEEKGANDSQGLRREFLVSYSHAVKAGCGPEKCIRCKKCLSACPQWVFKIPDEMKRIDAALAKVRADYVAKGGKL